MTIQEINKMCGTNYDSVEEFKDNVYWRYISRYQKLSEEFIKEFKDKIDWDNISMYQILSEEFIREFKDKVYWDYVSKYQKLSEHFIREFKVDLYFISKYQKLSENFIREFKDKVNWDYISEYQKLSEDFIKEFNLKIEDNWHYVNTEFKKQAIINSGLYECYDDHFIAYKGIRSDRYSNYNFQYQYLLDQEYESHCDCSAEENSFGLSVWTEEGAKEYCNELVVKVLVKYEDVGRVVHDSNKIRCFKIKILN